MNDEIAEVLVDVFIDVFIDVIVDVIYEKSGCDESWAVALAMRIRVIVEVHH